MAIVRRQRIRAVPVRKKAVLGWNPNPVTPPPPVPGERSAKSYYRMIRDYRGAAIDIASNPPKPNEDVNTYHLRLQRMCLDMRRVVT